MIFFVLRSLIFFGVMLSIFFSNAARPTTSVLSSRSVTREKSSTKTVQQRDEGTKKKTIRGRGKSLQYSTDSVSRLEEESLPYAVPSQAAQEAVAAAITSLGGAWSAVASSRPRSGYVRSIHFVVESLHSQLTLEGAFLINERRRSYKREEAVF